MRTDVVDGVRILSFCAHRCHVETQHDLQNCRCMISMQRITKALRESEVTHI